MKKALLKLLNKIAKEFDCSVVLGDSFNYYHFESKIEVAEITEPSKMDLAFLALARKNGLNEIVDAFTISFFHELGHCETIDEFDDDCFDPEFKNALTLEQYFYLDEEFAATDWAIDFCNEHLDLVRAIQKLQ